MSNELGTAPKNKLQELIELAKKKFKLGRKSKEDDFFDNEEEQMEQEAKDPALDPNKPIGEASMLDGEHGKIFGVSRPVVIGIGVFIFLVFSIALIMASGDDAGKSQQNDPKTQTESNINKTSDGKQNSGGLPSDYATLAKEQQAKNAKQQKTGQQTGQPGANGSVQAQRTNVPSAQQAVARQQPTSTVVPRVTSVAAPPSYSSPYPVAAQAAATPAIPAASAAPSESASSGGGGGNAVQQAEKALEDKFKSAIAFALGTNSADTAANASGTAGSGDASSGNAGGSQSSTPVASSNPDSTYQGASENTLTAGTVIPAMLLTGINTDVEGQVKAQVMADVYDYSGTNLLIPAGSQVLGSYTGGTSSQNGRVNVTFSTLVLPDGGAWNIGNTITAIDGGGYMGLAGTVHHHTGSNFMKGLMNSALTALSTAAVDRVTLDVGAFQNLTGENSNITVTVDPGYQFQLYVNNSITF